MVLNQNETKSEQPKVSGEGHASRPKLSTTPGTSAFTLTELLVVIAIIAVLAALATNAAINALNAGKRTAILLEIDGLNTAMVQFKTDHGSYPPNVFNNNDISNLEQSKNVSTLVRMLTKIAPRGTEFQSNLNPNTGQNNISPITAVGLSPAEALVFWLQGVSSDPQRPLSGSDLEVTSIDDGGSTITNVLTIDSFEPSFDFDRGRLRLSRNPDGSRRFLNVFDISGNPLQIQLYEYFPSGSEVPYVYFDTSRESPLQVANNWQTTEFFYSHPSVDGNVYPLKQLKPNAPDVANMNSPKLQFVEYVSQGKCQILHCGLDDAWGDFANSTQLNLGNNDFIPQLLYPAGPFIGDVADTLTNFSTGTLEDTQE